MTEEIKEKLLSEIGKSNINWKRPETMFVLKKKNIAYSSYYNAHTNNFGPLLEATIYTDNEVPTVPNADIVDYREVIGVK